MAEKRKFEEIVEDLRKAGEDDLADEFERSYGTSSLRAEAAKVGDLERERDELRGRVSTLERAPARDKAFREYGVDIENLRPAELRALEQYDGELEPEKIAAFVDELDLPLANEQTPPGEQAPPPAAAGVVAAARSAPAGRRAGVVTITPDDAEKWPADALYKWGEEHKEALNQLLQGQTVTGIAPPTF